MNVSSVCTQIQDGCSPKVDILLLCGVTCPLIRRDHLVTSLKVKPVAESLHQILNTLKTH